MHTSIDFSWIDVFKIFVVIFLRINDSHSVLSLGPILIIIFGDGNFMESQVITKSVRITSLKIFYLYSMLSAGLCVGGGQSGHCCVLSMNTRNAITCTKNDVIITFMIKPSVLDTVKPNNNNNNKIIITD